jgi:hypothetical protein
MLRHLLTYSVLRGLGFRLHRTKLSDRAEVALALAKRLASR